MSIITKLSKTSLFALSVPLLLVPIQAPSSAAAADLTVDEVIAKHIEARGGLDAWGKIASLKATGSFTGFSKVSPFTLHRERGGAAPRRGANASESFLGANAKYHFDHVLDGKPITIGYDGETAWWINLWYRVPWAQKIVGHDLKVFMQDVDFESPFFHYQDKGYQVELLGDGELDGQKALKLRLTRTDESVETWYLDPETYLELGYDAEGSDFGRPMPQRAFFDDFREVDGVIVPHFIEKQWYTRDRIMEIEQIETNLEIDDDLFRFPLPGAMGLMQAMAGEWNVKTEQRQSPEVPWQESEAESTIKPLMGGVLLEEHFVSPQGIEGLRTLSYDRFKERYRLTQINSFTSHLDVQEGTMEDGRLTVSNAETDTSWQGFGRTFHQRLSFYDFTPDGFKAEAEQSVDGGENWFVNRKAVYSRK